MRWRNKIPLLLAAFCCSVPVAAQSGYTAGAPARSVRPPRLSAALSATGACRFVVAGFRGAIEDPNDRHSGVVAIRNRLLALGHPDLCARIYSPYRQGRAINWILSQFDRDGSDPPTVDAIAHGPKIILYGYSLGAWAMMAVARQLNKEKIPIQVGVEVDGMWSASKTVPPNIIEAANFYQRKSLLMKGRDTIRARDPETSRIDGNFRVNGQGHYTIDLAPEVSDFVVAKVEALYAPE